MDITHYGGRSWGNLGEKEYENGKNTKYTFLYFSSINLWIKLLGFRSLGMRVLIGQRFEAVFLKTQILFLYALLIR